VSDIPPFRPGQSDLSLFCPDGGDKDDFSTNSEILVWYNKWLREQPNPMKPSKVEKKLKALDAYLENIPEEIFNLLRAAEGIKHAERTAIDRLRAAINNIGIVEQGDAASYKKRLGAKGIAGKSVIVMSHEGNKTLSRMDIVITAAWIYEKNNGIVDGDEEGFVAYLNELIESVEGEKVKGQMNGKRLASYYLNDWKE
jgi:hypothetical protein